MRVREKETETEISYMPAIARAGQTKNQDPELRLVLPRGWPGLRHLGHHPLPPGCAGTGLEWKQRPRECSLRAQMQVSQAAA